MMIPDRDALRVWAQRHLDDPNAVILNTETTGLDGKAEICQLAIIAASTGEVLLDTLVRPILPPSAAATAIHGLAIEHLIDAPRFSEVLPDLMRVLAEKIVLIYNLTFDMRMINQSLAACQALERLGALGAADWMDVMVPYSEWIGDWSDYCGSYRWQKLPGGDHSALGDCRATRNVLRRMANTRDVPVTIHITAEQEYLLANGNAMDASPMNGGTAMDNLRLMTQAMLDDFAGSHFTLPTTSRERLIGDWWTLWYAERGPERFNSQARRREIESRLDGSANTACHRIMAEIRAASGQMTKVELVALIDRVLALAREGTGQDGAS